MLYAEKLLSLGCAYGTYVCAGTAVNAGVSVDNVLAVALGNCVYGTFACASTAADALIGNNVSHSYVPPKIYGNLIVLIILYHNFRKKQEVIIYFFVLFIRYCKSFVILFGSI